MENFRTLQQIPVISTKSIPIKAKVRNQNSTEYVLTGESAHIDDSKDEIETGSSMIVHAIGLQNNNSRDVQTSNYSSKVT